MSRNRIIAAGAVALVALTACTAGGQHTPTVAVAAANGATCPQTIRVQSSWYPEVLGGGLYQMLIGGRYAVDTHLKRVSGPLMDEGKPTGINIEIRPGGPALAGRETAGVMLKLHRDLFIGQEALKDMVQERAAGVDTVAVLAPIRESAVMFGWDRTRHPEFQTLRDVGQTDTPVLAFKGSATNDFLVGNGILRGSQMDTSYTGAPDRLATDRSIVVGGTSTNEPYIYAHLNPPIDLAYEYVHDDGFPDYPNMLVVRPDDTVRYEDCLRWLVPVMQRAQVAFMNHPTDTLQLMSDLDERYPATFHYPLAQGEWGINVAEEDGLIGDGPDHLLGSIDPARVTKVIDALRPIFAGYRTPLPDGLSAVDLVNNAFVGHISMGR